MAKKPVSLENGRSWASQRAAEDHFRNIRDRYGPGKTVTSHADHDDLLALIRRHDLLVADGPSKEGVGVERFETRTNVTNGGRTVGFWIVRIDGSETDFSFIRAVAGAARSGEGQLMDACRGAVIDDLHTARIAHFAANSDKNGCIECEVTGRLIAERESGFDYVGRRFADIVVDWMSAMGWSDGPPPSVLNAPGDAQTTTVFRDQSVANDFRRFHRRNARVRIVDRSARGQDAGGPDNFLEL